MSRTDETKPEKRGRPLTSGYGSASVTDSELGAPSRGDTSIEPERAREVLPPGTGVGRYQLIRLIGEGGMGGVYEATDTRLGRRVALKILSRELKSKRKAAKRFAIEAKAAARLHHPNVVAIYDFDVDCEYPYMAMEYLDGETLASAIARGPLGFAGMADIMLGVCAGVFAAHQAGIVHRDLKPSNIFLGRDWKGNQTARVLDFGISKVGGLSSSDLTQTGDIVGTSQYLSPEQASGSRQVTGLSDQYALGVVMYECLTQHTPQRGQPIYTLLRNVIDGRHARPHELRRDLPAALESVIERAMSVEPQRRFPSVLHLAQALFAFASAPGKAQFADFCGPGRAPAEPGRASNEASPHPDRPAVFATTRRLGGQSPSPWQKGATRTGHRSALSRPRSPRVQSRRRPRQTARVLLSIVLGIALAAAALVGAAFFIGR